MTERRECYVGSPGWFLLNQACLAVHLAFGTVPYLVGSAVERRDFRDVDVRVMLADVEYERLFPGALKLGNPRVHPLWSLLCSSISLQLGQATRLRVDFQVQPDSVAQTRYGKRPRIPLGIFPTTSEGGQPSE